MLCILRETSQRFITWLYSCNILPFLLRNNICLQFIEYYKIQKYQYEKYWHYNKVGWCSTGLSNQKNDDLANSRKYMEMPAPRLFNRLRGSIPLQPTSLYLLRRCINASPFLYISISTRWLSSNRRQPSNH